MDKEKEEAFQTQLTVCVKLQWVERPWHLGKRQTFQYARGTRSENRRMAVIEAKVKKKNLVYLIKVVFVGEGELLNNFE